jgi:hypothetical protein
MSRSVRALLILAVASALAGCATTHAQVTALRKELAREKAKHAATAEVLRIIRASPTDLQPVAQAIVDAARRLCGCTWVGLFRFDGQMLHWIAARDS